MKNLIKKGWLTAIVSIAFTAVYSQIPTQWSRTLQLTGYWEGPAVLILGGQSFNLTYHTDFKEAVDGNVLTMDEGFADPDLGELKGANLIGLNASDGLIHWFSADNFGTAHEHTGSWITPKHLYIEHQSTVGGQAYFEAINIRLRANDSRALVDLVATLDGDTVEVLTATLYLQNSGNRIVGSTKESEVLIYPNPSSGHITIETEKNMDVINITNEAGQILYTAKPASMEFTYEPETDGIYIIQVMFADRTVTEKVFFQK